MATAEEQANAQTRRFLRLFLNDTAELNRLIRREESNDERLDLAIQLALSDWNTTPPVLGTFTVANFPSLFLMIYGATIQVLRSQGLLHARNELVYSSGGVSVRIFDKTQLYQSWIAQFVQEYETKKLRYKKAINISGSFADGVSSEYAFLNSFW